MTHDDLLFLTPPRPVTIYETRLAEPLLQAAEDELAVLDLELAELEAELARAHEEAVARGLDHATVAAAVARVEGLSDQLLADAEAHAAAVVTQAREAAAALIQRAKLQATTVRGGPGSPAILAPPPAAIALATPSSYATATAAVPVVAPATASAFAPPVPPTPAAAMPVPPPGWVPATMPPQMGWGQQMPWAPPPGWAPIGWAPNLPPEAPKPPPEPYSKAVGMLQVVSWSVLVAVVLIVLLAWFA